MFDLFIFKVNVNFSLSPFPPLSLYVSLPPRSRSLSLFLSPSPLLARPPQKSGGASAGDRRRKANTLPTELPRPFCKLSENNVSMRELFLNDDLSCRLLLLANTNTRRVHTLFLRAHVLFVHVRLICTNTPIDNMRSET